MALRKNKIDLLDKIFTLEVDEYNIWWDDYDTHWDHFDCDCDDCIRTEYKYVGEYSTNSCHGTGINPCQSAEMVMTKGRLGWCISNRVIVSRQIDMNSIYTKEEMRERKIDQILGESIPPIPTFGDIIKR